MNLRKSQGKPILSAERERKPDPPSPDSGSRGVAFTRIFAALLGATYLWVLLTPFVSAISLAGMRRFNLLTETFPAWAIQQPVPSMYNFANFGAIFPEALEQHAALVATNHFPTRHYTFTFRSSYEPSLPQVLLTSSTYQGKKVSARHVVKKAPGGGSEMILEPAR